LKRSRLIEDAGGGQPFQVRRLELATAAAPACGLCSRAQITPFSAVLT
jgi:hypothetical protein